MDVKLVLAVTYKKDREIFFLVNDDCSLMSTKLDGTSYQEAAQFFERIFGYYPYPFSVLSQVGFFDDVTESPLLVYYANLLQHEIPKAGKWVNIESLSKDEAAFMIYGRSVNGVV